MGIGHVDFANWGRGLTKNKTRGPGLPCIVSAKGRVNGRGLGTNQ